MRSSLALRAHTKKHTGKQQVDRRNISPQQLSQNRQKVLLDCAHQAFLKKGLGNCSIDYIAKTSGVSKSTIYRHFANKEAIFEAVNLDVADRQGEEVTAFQLDIEQPRKSLQAFAHHIYTIDTKPEYLESFRLLIAEAGRMPKLIDSIRERGIMKVLSVTTRFFEQLIEQGIINHPSAQQAAITFYVLARGNFRPLLGAQANLEEELLRLDIDINVFLKGIELI